MVAAVGIEIVIIVVLVIANGVLAMAEMAMVSARKARLEHRAQTGDRRARVALELAATPGRYLSTVQIGITLVGVLAGALGGATLGEQLGARIARAAPAFAPYAEAIGVGLVVVAITYLSLILGELVPKQLALHAPERVASLLARPLRLLSRLSGPVVHLLDLSSRGVLRLLGTRPQEESPITEEELKILLEQGTRAGVFEASERDMVRRVLHLGDLRVGELVTHRSQVVALDVDDAPETNWCRAAASGHSRFPVYQGNLDRVLGIVSVKALLAQQLAGGRDLRAAMVEPLYLPESLPALAAVERFRASGRQAALVLDEYGGIEGLVTLNDVLQAIVGDLPTPQETGPLVASREDGSWLVDGGLGIGELHALLQVTPARGEELEEYQTLGGFVMGRLGRVPAPADQFTWADWRFEVAAMDGRRVGKVLVSPAV
ncbi:MAG TPA: hemolysin family protein [Thermoanaerobaculia bacterium]|nr:hemolysin family protein [Thermoanaerobaculia bacterium]